MPVAVDCREADGFCLLPEMLAAAVTRRTRWLLLNSPPNPTGATYTASQLRDLASVLERHPAIWVLSDDMYEHMSFDERSFATMVQAAPELRGRTSTMDGVSKACAMTGWHLAS